MDSLDQLLRRQPGTAARPLLGLTVLVVEDSRLASDGLRLLCQRSGGRIRRADTLAAAERHLRTYRPDAVIVDAGLPDGSGLDLVARLSRAAPRIDVILAMSGDDAAEAVAREAGADAFLRKPVLGLAAFQAAILAHLPADRLPPGLRLVTEEIVTPDALAYREDLSTAAEALGPRTAYATQFLSGVARSAGDVPMTAAVEAVIASDGGVPQLAALGAMVRSRLAAAPLM